VIRQPYLPRACFHGRLVMPGRSCACPGAYRLQPMIDKRPAGRTARGGPAADSQCARAVIQPRTVWPGWRCSVTAWLPGELIRWLLTVSTMSRGLPIFMETRWAKTHERASPAGT
jgi:hypothetical protein